MRVSDLALELKITEEQIVSKLKTLKLKAKGETQELNAVVELVLRDEFAKEGIVSSKSIQLLEEEDKPKKKAKSVKAKTAKTDEPEAKAKKSTKTAKAKEKSGE